MRRINKKNTTYMGMAFLFLSLTVTPISLKAVGISPSLSAGVDAWRQVASVFGDSHQPVTSSELLALSNLKSGEADSANRDNEIPQCLFAQLQPDWWEAAAPQMSDAEPHSEAASNQQKRCFRSAVHSPRIVKRVELASVINPEVEIDDQALEAANGHAMIIKAEDWKRIRKQLARSKVEIGETMKILPVKEFKMLVKLKEMNIALPAGISKCDARSEQIRELRLRASRARDAESPAPAADNCEL